MKSWQLYFSATLFSFSVQFLCGQAKFQATPPSVTEIISKLLSCCLQVVEETEAHSKQHMDDSQNYRHFHLERVQEGQFVAGDVPDLHT